MPPAHSRTAAGRNRRAPALTSSSPPATVDAAARARANLAERRRRQDHLLDAVTEALAAREAARSTIAGAQASLDQALAALTDLGRSGHELAAILGVAVTDLGAGPRGRAAATTAVAARPRRADEPGGGDDDDDGAVRIWLAMIEHGAAPKTHGLGTDGGLLCRGRADAGELTTWVGYAFDVDCHRCERLLHEHLSDEEFG